LATISSSSPRATSTCSAMARWIPSATGNSSTRCRRRTV
jgi:hypothetical protein